jgi:hypothetical protein
MSAQDFFSGSSLTSNNHPLNLPPSFTSSSPFLSSQTHDPLLNGSLQLVWPMIGNTVDGANEIFLNEMAAQDSQKAGSVTDARFEMNYGVNEVEAENEENMKEERDEIS